MHYLSLLADASPQWFRDLLQPNVMALMVPLVAIVGGITYPIVKAMIRHRERMAKIEHGIDPDAPQNPC